MQASAASRKCADPAAERHFFSVPAKKEIYLLISFLISNLQRKSRAVSEQQLSGQRHLTLGAELR
jgi:hypothetical protein